MTGNVAVNAVRRVLTVTAAFCSALILAFSLLPATTAQALTTNKATARSNEDSGNQILGGIPTRITWEGTVESDDIITTLTLIFPEGSKIDPEARIDVKLQTPVGNDWQATQPEFERIITDSQLTIIFAEPIADEGSIIQVQAQDTALPAEDGSYVVSGNWIDASGVLHQLEDSSPPITVIVPTVTQRIVQWLDGQEWVEAWNSIRFFQVFLNPQWIVASIPALFKGWLGSLALVLCGFPLAIPVGLGISFLRMSKLRILRFISGIYVNVIRGTPLFLQIYIAILGLPLLDIKLNSFVVGIIVLAVNSSAYLAEIFRAGIQSIHKGQFEASASLGMNSVQTMFSVIIPQTVRRIIPTATSEFILLFKDTSLLAAVGIAEMMMSAKHLVATTGLMTPYVVAACFYLVVTLPLTRVISVFEKKLAASEGREAPPEDDKKATKRVGLFKTIAPLSATDSDPMDETSPERHASE